MDGTTKDVPRTVGCSIERSPVPSSLGHDSVAGVSLYIRRLGLARDGNWRAPSASAFPAGGPGPPIAPLQAPGAAGALDGEV